MCALGLLAAGEIPDPFHGDNQKTLQWISDSSWTYTRIINISPDFLSHARVLLRCEGLDTMAEISINDQPIASTDNMFRTFEFDVKSALKTGENTIKITFRPIGPLHQKIYRGCGWTSEFSERDRESSQSAPTATVGTSGRNF